MDYFKINLFIVVAFLLISLIVGLWAGRKVTTMRDYALADKSYGTGSLVMTYLATSVGAYWMFGRPKEIFECGIWPILAVFCWPISMYIAAKYIAPKMLQFRNCLTLGDIMGQLYGLKSKFLAGVLSALFSSIIVGMNISFLGIICEKFLSLNGTVGVIISTIVVILYTYRGGIRAVVATDIVQFVVLSGMLAVMAILAVNKIGGAEILFSKIPSEKFNFSICEKNYSYLSLIFVDLLFFAKTVEPVLLERTLMAKSPYHISRMLKISSLAIALIILAIASISFAALILYPEINSSTIMFHMISELLPKWTQGFAMIGIIAIIFSTADSYMHSAGVAFSHDVVKPFKDKFGIKINEVKWAGFSVIVIGILAIWFALWGRHIFRPQYFLCIITPIFAAPMMFGVFGIKPEEKAFWTSAIAASITLIVCMAADFAYHPIISAFSLPISVFASAITYMIVHIKINKGIYIITNHGFSNPDKKLYESKEKAILYQIVDLILYPIHFADRCRKKVKIYGTPPYVLFGAFYLVVLVAPYFIGQRAPSPYDDLILALRFVGIIICSLLMTESIWPEIMRKYLPAFWYLALAYCLPFLSTILFILTGGATEYLINVSVSVIFLLLLADWKSILSIAVIGIVAALLFCKYGVGSAFDMEELNFDFHTKYLLGYQLIFAAIVGLLFVKRRQSSVETIKKRKVMVEEKNKLLKKQFHAALSVEDRITQGLGMREINMLERIVNLEQLNEDFLKAVPDKKDFIERYTEASQTLKYLENLSNQAKEYTKLNVNKVSIDLFLSSIDEMASLYSKDYSIVVRTEITEFECDATGLSNVITDALENIHTLNVEDDHLEIDIANTEIIYTLPSLPNYEKKLKALQFTISTAQTLDDKMFPKSYREELRNPKDILSNKESNIDSIMSERIMAAHFGLSKIINDENGHTAIFVVPVNLREIRPLPLDLEVPKEVIITWPGALELENELKKEITLKAPKVNLDRVEKAIDLIRKYHYHQNRHSGEPYYLHPVQVAMIVLTFSQEEDAILGALLHDTIEDTALHIMDIKTMFGDRVAEIVVGVSKIDFGGISKFQSNYEHLATLDKKDIITLTVKIADRLHNMRTLHGHKSASKRRAVAKETLDFFVPLAKNLGLVEAAEELKSLSEKELNVSKK